MKAVRTVINLLLCIAAAVALLVFLPELSGVKAYVVLSGSMEPCIKAGGIVYTDTNKKNPKPGDIITYELAGTQVTHRVVRVEKGAFITRGDANNAEDAKPVTQEQVTGTVLFSIPYIGYLVCMLHRKAVAAVFIWIVFLSVFLDYVDRFGQKNRKGECGEKSAQ